MRFAASDVLALMRGTGDPLARALAEEIEAASELPFVDRAELLARVRQRAMREERAEQLFQDREREDAFTAKRPRRGAAPLKARTSALLDAMRNSVERLRTAWFGAPTPPFADLAAAATWIETEAAREKEPPSRDEGLARTDYALRYWKSSGLPGYAVQTQTNERGRALPLFALERWSTALSKQTSLPAASLLAYALVGLVPGQPVRLSDGRSAPLPGLRLVRLRLSYGGRVRPWDPDIERPRVVLDMDLEDVTDRNLRLARQELVEWLKPRLQERRASSLTSKQRAIVRVVESMGGSPAVRLDRDFWERANRKLSRSSRVEDPIALARRYYRAKQKERSTP